MILGDGKCDALHNFDAHEEKSLKRTMSKFESHWSFSNVSGNERSNLPNPLFPNISTDDDNENSETNDITESDAEKNANDDKNIVISI